MYAVLFDIDGTLLLTGGAGKLCFVETLREDFGIMEAKGDVPFAGRSDRAIAEELMEANGVEPCAENWEHFFEGYCRRMEGALRRSRGARLPGVVELLDELGRVDHVLVGLLTGNAEHGAWAKLGHYGLGDRFSFGGFGDNYTERNDIAAAALAAAEREARERGNGAIGKLHGAMVIGDTISDVRCAKSIGAFAVGVATGSTSLEELAESGADLVLANLSDSRPILSVVQSHVKVWHHADADADHRVSDQVARRLRTGVG